jgi:hypothetical protein
VRTAESGDAAALKATITTTLAHPDHQGRRESYGGGGGRGGRQIDVGTTGDQPQTGVVRYLLDQAFNSFRPAGAQVKIRRDARSWLDIFSSIPGFYLEGEEYRRPHYWTIWRWDRQRARDAEQQAQRPPERQQRPRPPQPPSANGQAERSTNWARRFGAGRPSGPPRSRGPHRPRPPRSS